jgi:atlastin
LAEEHGTIRMVCLEQFFNAPKMGGDVFSAGYMKKLELMIDESYNNFCKRNEGKQLMNAYRTPAVLCLVMVISYIVSTILDLLGVESLSQTAVLGLYLPLFLVSVWIYIRYTGHLRDIGQIIDNFTNAVWENLLQPIYQKLMEKGIQQAVSMSTQSAANTVKKIN